MKTDQQILAYVLKSTPVAGSSRLIILVIQNHRDHVYVLHLIHNKYNCRFSPRLNVHSSKTYFVEINYKIGVINPSSSFSMKYYKNTTYYIYLETFQKTKCK